MYVNINQTNMSSEEVDNSSVDYTKISPVKTYMYGNTAQGKYSTPSLPNIKPDHNGVNKSQDYSSNNTSHNGFEANSLKSGASSRSRRRINYEKIIDREGVEMYN